MRITLGKINTLIKKWQTLLQLNEWTIESYIEELDGKNSIIQWHGKTHWASITVSPDIEDLEKGIIHELSHLLFADWYDNVDMITRSFIKDESVLKCLRDIHDKEEHRVTERLVTTLYFLGGKDRTRKIWKGEKNDKKSISVQHKRKSKKMGRRFSKKSHGKS